MFMSKRAYLRFAMTRMLPCTVMGTFPVFLLCFRTCTSPSVAFLRVIFKCFHHPFSRTSQTSRLDMQRRVEEVHQRKAAEKAAAEAAAKNKKDESVALAAKMAVCVVRQKLR